MSKGDPHGNAIGVMHHHAITVDEILSQSEHFDPARHQALRSSRTVTVGQQAEICFENRATALSFLQSIVALEGLSCPVSLAAECDVAEGLWRGPEGHIALALTLVPEARQTPGELTASLAASLHRLCLHIGSLTHAVILEGPLAPRMHGHVRLTPAARAALRGSDVDVRLGWDAPTQTYAQVPRAIWATWAAS